MGPELRVPMIFFVIVVKGLFRETGLELHCHYHTFPLFAEVISSNSKEKHQKMEIYLDVT